MSPNNIAVIGSTVEDAKSYAAEVLQPGWKAFNIHQHRELVMSGAKNFIIRPDCSSIPEPMLNALVLLMGYRGPRGRKD